MIFAVITRLDEPIYSVWIFVFGWSSLALTAVSIWYYPIHTNFQMISN